MNKLFSAIVVVLDEESRKLIDIVVMDYLEDVSPDDVDVMEDARLIRILRIGEKRDFLIGLMLGELYTRCFDCVVIKKDRSLGSDEAAELAEEILRRVANEAMFYLGTGWEAAKQNT